MWEPDTTEGRSRAPDLREFARSVGHDFNNLVTAILGAVSLARDDLPQDSLPYARLDQVLLSARRATYLSRQLLRLGDSGRVPLPQNALDINEIVLAARSLLELSLPGEAVLFYELAPELPPASIDPWDLQGVCQALTTNAGEALPEGRGVVTIRTGVISREAPRQATSDAADALVWLEVHDDGAGIDPGDAKHVSDAFFTTRAGKRGLGLFYVKTVVSSLGGDLEIRSSPGDTTVRVLLPAT